MAPSQHAETMETIMLLRQKMQRDKTAASDEPIQSGTNRYNKLKQGASYVRQGAMPYQRGPHGYKQPIEHAGYQRNIVARNPQRYNMNGDELDDSESDPEADANAREENPYGEVRIEELLRPLTHPSELATHPAMSIPYTDGVLEQQVRDTEERLRTERKTLWQCKNLQSRYNGDEVWIPGEKVETPNDWDLFEPKPRIATESSLKRKRGGTGPKQNGNDPHEQTTNPAHSEPVATNDGSSEHSIKLDGVNGLSRTENKDPADNDLVMRDADDAVETAGMPASVGAQIDGNTPNDQEKDQLQDRSMDDTRAEDPDGSDPDSPPQPSRRITRALAAENNSPEPDGMDSPAASIDSSLLQPAPIFLLPSHLQPPSEARLALIAAKEQIPIEELLETRRILSAFISKQEECVRGFESILEKLYHVKRMKDEVWRMCKAERHAGQLSDGEDHIDEQAWGLEPGELKKGKDEEEQAAEDRERERAAGAAGGADDRNGLAVGGVNGNGANATTRAKGKGKRRARAVANRTALDTTMTRDDELGAQNGAGE